MTLRYAAWSSLLALLTVACSDNLSQGGSGRGGAGGSGQSGGSSGSGTGGSSTGGTTGTGGLGTGGSTGGSGGSTGGTTGTGGTAGTGGSGTGGAGTGGASGTGGAGTGGTGGTAGAGTGGAGTGGSAGTGGAGTGGSAGTGGAGTAGTGGTGGVMDAGGKDGTAGTAGSAGSAGKDGGSGGSTVDAAPPPPVDGGPPVPPPNGTCPDFTTGDVTFNPAGGARTVAITMGDASKTGGPLIVYWHATGSNPSEPTRAGGGLPVSAVAAAGGIIAAPHDVPNAGTFPWLSNYTLHDTLFDEIFACAVQKTKVSPGRVHTLGFSAGGMMATHLSFARSKYLASVAAYSGGGSAQFQEMNNKFGAIIVTGGTGDIYGGTTNFYDMGKTWQTTLKNAGHFAGFCDHGGGHRLPNATVVGGVFQFFMDHPYGTNPSPYAGGKIPSALSICTE